MAIKKNLNPVGLLCKIPEFFMLYSNSNSTSPVFCFNIHVALDSNATCILKQNTGEVLFELMIRV